MNWIILSFRHLFITSPWHQTNNIYGQLYNKILWYNIKTWPNNIIIFSLITCQNGNRRNGERQSSETKNGLRRWKMCVEMGKLRLFIGKILLWCVPFQILHLIYSYTMITRACALWYTVVAHVCVFTYNILYSLMCQRHDSLSWCTSLIFAHFDDFLCRLTFRGFLNFL